MRIAVFGSDRRVGLVREKEIVDVNRAYAKFLAETGVRRWMPWSQAHVPVTLSEFIIEGDHALGCVQQAVAYLDTEAQDDTGPDGEPVRFVLDAVRLHPPVAAADARLMMCFANFADHVRDHRRHRFGETPTLEEVVRAARASGPAHFLKHIRTIVGPDDPVRHPARTERFDYEGEVAIVLGRSGRDVSAAELPGLIWGYVLVNDWSVRDYANSARDFGYTKNFDTAASLGPWISVGEIPDAQDVPFSTAVNGAVRQRGNTSDMIFGFGELVEYLSRDLTLQPGDMISSGTPSGTAHDSSPLGPDGRAVPDLFLQPGDEVEVASPAIGCLRNVVVKA